MDRALRPEAADDLLTELDLLLRRNGVVVARAEVAAALPLLARRRAALARLSRRLGAEDALAPSFPPRSPPGVSP